MPLARGVRIGAYEIVDTLGAGGVGEVYRAHDPKLTRRVAIKVLNADASANASAVRRFELEARTASALNHPGIVTIHDIGHSEGRCYIVMELVEGVTLRQVLRRGAPPLKKALQIAGQLAAALAKAHDAGVVHRDLKPENVMVTSAGHVKIVDFGLAKLAEPDAPSQQSDTQSAHGASIGTLGYLSPEQARGEPADFRSDQFAFGAILYELTTGARAFHRPTAVDTLSMLLNEAPAAPQTIRPSIPAPVVWSIERCLSKDPADRYASTRDLARQIQTLTDRVGGLGAGATPARAAARRALVVTAVAMALAAGGAAYLALQRTGAGAGAAAPTFTQLTFGRGHIVAARFAPEGQAVLYAAAWNGEPVQVFETRLTGPESRRWDPAGASLASVSSSGELALLLGCRVDWGNCIGTLARMPRGGGAPRELLENVASADFAPDGTRLAAIQMVDGEYQLQFPLGKTMYTSSAKLGFLRVSPRGDKLAFVEYEAISDEKGVLKVVDLEGRLATLSSGWQEIREIAWSPDGDEVWVSGSERGRDASVYSISSAGTRRLVLHRPGGVFLKDVTADGRALVTSGGARAHMMWWHEEAQRELSWLDWSTVVDLSADGKTVLFYEWGEAVGAQPVVYLRTSDGADAIRLGDGKALALSPDGRWALALREAPSPHLVLLPTGPGETRLLPTGGLTDFYWARWFPDGRRLLVVGEDANRVPTSYIQHLDTGHLESIADNGVLARLVSPDGTRVLVQDPLKGYLLWPLDGGHPVALHGLHPDHRPVQWSADGQFLYVTGRDGSVVRLHRFDIATGKTELMKELRPQDPSGVIGIADGRGELAVTRDGRTCVLTYWTWSEDLFLVEELGS